MSPKKTTVFHQRTPKQVLVICRKQIGELLRFPSSKSGDDLISLGQYTERAKEGQKNIYYIAADSLAAAASAPFVEQLIKKDLEVGFLALCLTLSVAVFIPLNMNIGISTPCTIALSRICNPRRHTMGRPASLRIFSA